MTYLALIKDPNQMDRDELLAENTRLRKMLEHVRDIGAAAIDWRTASTGDLARANLQALARAVDAHIAASIRDVIAIGEGWENEQRDQALADPRDPARSLGTWPEEFPGGRR